jgi:hypothetical protein
MIFAVLIEAVVIGALLYFLWWSMAKHDELLDRIQAPQYVVPKSVKDDDERFEVGYSDELRELRAEGVPERHLKEYRDET